MPVDEIDYTEQQYSVIGTQLRGIKRNIRRERALRTKKAPLLSGNGKFPMGAPSVEKSNIFPFVPPVGDYDWVIIEDETNEEHNYLKFFNANEFDALADGAVVGHRLTKGRDRRIVLHDAASYTRSFPQRMWFIKGGKGNGIFPSRQPDFTWTAAGVGTFIYATQIDIQSSVGIILWRSDKGYDIIPFADYRNAIPEDDLLDPYPNLPIRFNRWYAKSLFPFVGGSPNLMVADVTAGTVIKGWYIRNFYDGFGKIPGSFPDFDSSPDLEVTVSSVSGSGTDTGALIKSAREWAIVQVKATIDYGVASGEIHNTYTSIERVDRLLNSQWKRVLDVRLGGRLYLSCMNSEIRLKVNASLRDNPANSYTLKIWYI